MKLNIRGIEYFFEKHQDNDELPTLVLLHGFMGSGALFKALIQHINPFCNPVTIDLLGHGQTEGAELHYRFSTKEQVADLVKLIQEQLPTPTFCMDIAWVHDLHYRLHCIDRIYFQA